LEPTRVLAFGLSPYTGGIVADIVAREPDLEIDEMPTLPELFAALDTTPRAVVLLGNGAADLAAHGERLFRERPRAKVLAVADGGRDTFTLELEPHTVRFGQVSPAGLVEIIRETARANAESGT
jgi:hypothetical protein